MERKTKMKIGYFIKEKKDQNGNVKLHQRSEKTLRTQVAQNQIRKEQISTPQISTKKQDDVFNTKNGPIIRQLNVNRSQPSLGPLSFTV